MDKSYWYAVMQDDDDNDWGYGSYDLEEAKRMAEEFADGYIAVIDEGADPVCIDEIRREPDDLWTVAELIEALQQCPPDYRIALTAHGLPSVGLATLGIDTVREAVDLFAE